MNIDAVCKVPLCHFRRNDIITVIPRRKFVTHPNKTVTSLVRALLRQMEVLPRGSPRRDTAAIKLRKARTHGRWSKSSRKKRKP